MPDPDVEPISNRMEATFAGPIGSAYEGGIFKVLIKIPAEYPFRCGHSGLGLGFMIERLTWNTLRYVNKGVLGFAHYICTWF